MPDVAARYRNFFDFIAFLGSFINDEHTFMSEVLYLHQTFTDFVSDLF